MLSNMLGQLGPSSFQLCEILKKPKDRKKETKLAAKWGQGDVLKRGNARFSTE